MRILFLDWKSFCNEDLIEEFTRMGHEVRRVPFGGVKTKADEIRKALEGESGVVFSFNYFPAVSNVCQELEIKYISWVYDSPYIHVYSYTVVNSCNYVFLFDYATYEELSSAGIRTVYYLPMAVNERRLGKVGRQTARLAGYAADISFVGSLYSEEQHRLYDKFHKLDEYTRGYLDGLIQAQLNVQGLYFLQEMLTPDLIERMQEVYPTDPNDTTVLSPGAIYADYVLARRVTALERQEILAHLGKTYQVQLYTYDKSAKIAGVRNRGLIDYYNDMPYVFHASKINLNITLRSIKTGIPLRAMDIMGSGGFLLTNYQEELFEYFEPDVDFVYYEDYGDLEEKAAFYLAHDEERKRIAESGCRKVSCGHTFSKRAAYMLHIATGVGDEDTFI